MKLKTRTVLCICRIRKTTISNRAHFITNEYSISKYSQHIRDHLSRCTWSATETTARELPRITDRTTHVPPFRALPPSRRAHAHLLLKAGQEGEGIGAADEVPFECVYLWRVLGVKRYTQLSLKCSASPHWLARLLGYVFPGWTRLMWGVPNTILLQVMNFPRFCPVCCRICHLSVRLFVTLWCRTYSFEVEERFCMHACICIFLARLITLKSGTNLVWKGRYCTCARAHVRQLIQSCTW